MTKAELKPCPFCGATDPLVVGAPDAPKGKVFIGCDTCGGRGLASQREENAAKFWNRRPSPIESGDVAEWRWEEVESAARKYVVAIYGDYKCEATLGHGGDGWSAKVNNHGVLHLEDEAAAKSWCEQRVRADIAKRIAAANETMRLYAALAPSPEGGEIAEGLARELAEDRHAAAEQAHDECGTEPYDLTVDDFMDDARAFVMRCAALTAPPSANEGWKLVPVEPTDEMLNADALDVGVKTARKAWAAMLSASPSRKDGQAKEIERLKAALEPFDDALGEDEPHLPDETMCVLSFGPVKDFTLALGHFRAARAALNGEKG